MILTATSLSLQPLTPLFKSFQLHVLLAFASECRSGRLHHFRFLPCWARQPGLERVHQALHQPSCMPLVGPVRISGREGRRNSMCEPPELGCGQAM